MQEGKPKIYILKFRKRRAKTQTEYSRVPCTTGQLEHFQSGLTQLHAGHFKQ